MSDKHLSSQYDAALDVLTSRLLAMGGTVESQLARVLELLNGYDPTLMTATRDVEQQLNAMELEIDEEINRVIARRQPAARDLRLLMAMSKCVTNLERVGDEAKKVAKRIRRIHENGPAPDIPLGELRASGEMALTILRRALDAFARMEVTAAARIVHDDKAIDHEFSAFVRKLVTRMSASPLMVPVALEYLFMAKAFERIGDHATNIAEFVVYVVKGRDVRHVSFDALEREVLGMDDEGRGRPKQALL
jgi:phosphate transport system protein